MSLRAALATSLSALRWANSDSVGQYREDTLLDVLVQLRS